MFLIPTGLIFIFFYINLIFTDMTVDILPDILGYALIAVNAWRFRGKSYHFSRALWVSAVMGIYSLAVRIVVPTGFLGLVLSAVEYAGILWLLKLLVDGVGELEERAGTHLNGTLLDRWRTLVSAAYIATFLLAVGQVFLPGLEIFGLVIVTAWAVLCLLFTVVFFRTAMRYRKLMKQEEEKKGPPKKQYISAPLSDRRR